MISCIVIDDDRHTTKVFSELLELMGLKVIGNGFSGSEAVCLYRQYRPNVIFIDIMMPKTDGLYAIEKIKEFDPEAKIIAVTADLTLETHAQLKKMNITAVICKPFSQHEIKQVLLEQYQINTR